MLAGCGVLSETAHAKGENESGRRPPFLAFVRTGRRFREEPSSFAYSNFLPFWGRDRDFYFLFCTRRKPIFFCDIRKSSWSKIWLRPLRTLPQVFVQSNIFHIFRHGPYWLSFAVLEFCLWKHNHNECISLFVYIFVRCTSPSFLYSNLFLHGRH